MNVYARTYRPVRFADMVGQQHIRPILKAMVHQGRVPPALLFSGTRGTGKTSTARIFAAALNCTDRATDGDACGKCAQCLAVQKTNSMSVLEIDAASNGGVEEVRRIKELVLNAHDANYRVILIDEAHSLSKEANNALLKVLEEPPANTVFVLVTTEPEKILGTVRSRSMPFEFRRIRLAELEERLRYIAEAEGITADDSLFAEIAKAAEGGMRDAVMLLDQVQRVEGVLDAEAFRSFYGLSNYSVPLMWAALRGDFAEGYRLIGEHFNRTGEAAGMVSDLSRLTADLLVIKSEGRPDYPEEALAERVEMASAAPTEAFVRVVEVLWELRARTRATEKDQRSSMEMGFALIANSLKAMHVKAPAPRQEPAPAPTPEVRPEPPKLSLSDIQNFQFSD